MSQDGVTASLPGWFRDQISMIDELDDPLEPYINYLKECENSNVLIQLLEDVTRKFKDDQLYSNDIRYLKLWLHYIKFSNSPRKIFLYLHKKQIGSKLTLFYESFARYLESEGEIIHADELYQMAISNNSKPINRLLKSYTLFKNRHQQLNERSHLFSEPTQTAHIFVKNPNLEYPVRKLITNKNKKDELFDFNLDLIYRDNEEFCFEEILAISYNLYDYTENNPQKNKENQNPAFLQQKLQDNPELPLEPSEIRQVRHDILHNKTLIKPIAISSSPEQSPASSPFVENVDSSMEDQEPLTQPLIEKITLNPMSPDFHSELLKKLNPPLSHYSRISVYPKPLNKLSVLTSIFRADKNRMVLGNKNTMFQFGEKMYCITKLLGEGGYATVFLAESDLGELVAIKVQNPVSLWEFYVFKTIENRLASLNPNDKLVKSFVLCQSFQVYQDETYLIMDYLNQDTLLEVINVYRSLGKSGVDEQLVLFLTIELLTCIEFLHDIGIIHGDLKPDNCMVRFEKIADSKWSEFYDATGNNGWCKKGITLIDFGRSIDMTLFPNKGENVNFLCNWKVDEQDCPEMRNGEPWTYQADYFGLASIVHFLLFGKSITLRKDENGNYRINESFKRYWQVDLWNEFFFDLLNSTKVGTRVLPNNDILSKNKIKLCHWLTHHSQGLKKSISDLELIYRERSKKVFKR
ncbi:Checkpoint serine/threonine-protein kinase [Komagataella phaffii CBS 7435]|uniref:Protein kinase that forms a complex with Mad1p and Bub3p n=2 Tax=Komagataella phaffii TaxID=460519 RepID=C4R0L4_KOMPG|nr:Protein kinase that forms a complex with Mad1p and Bub3p [Komagataella phaffii GS115]AOA62485.1 GQ67_00458T0 [Komagataella phaffii]CAH2448443.1 Checkpoint serine/threonine-protein kinase [Komagataella phaffii CBS 7435]AOA66968.1 GQ68_00931T0 [Komagataella phaffii GS115]CAY69038.1 Protein kinase that forms a complex with Mad1p and Bub3p [Komagataella phaffii GS115]CCA38564.1 Checkpoint serine/threonine-protein kinase [Komagataella phaffii CBS 7435]